MPTPEQFVNGAQFRAGGQAGIEAQLDGVVYDVVPFGDDAVQVVDRETRAPVATLAMENGQFVVPGQQA